MAAPPPSGLVTHHPEKAAKPTSGYLIRSWARSQRHGFPDACKRGAPISDPISKRLLRVRFRIGTRKLQATQLEGTLCPGFFEDLARALRTCYAHLHLTD